MICFEPVQVSTAFSQLSETYHNKGCDQPHSACTLLLECRRRRGARMPTSFGGRRIHTSWGVTLFCLTGAEHPLLVLNLSPLASWPNSDQSPITILFQTSIFIVKSLSSINKLIISRSGFLSLMEPHLMFQFISLYKYIKTTWRYSAHIVQKWPSIWCSRNSIPKYKNNWPLNLLYTNRLLHT
jgi:hypothetical protein